MGSGKRGLDQLMQISNKNLLSRNWMGNISLVYNGGISYRTTYSPVSCSSFLIR
jgi:hypothetical protein